MRNRFECLVFNPTQLTLGVTFLIGCFFPTISAAQSEQESSNAAISYTRQVRPVLAAKCFGCHQAKIDKGSYVMTEFESLLAGGESGSEAIVPGKPDESYLLELIEAHDGQAEMPPEEPPISAEDFKMIRQWILQGANNDEVDAGPRYTTDAPPQYNRRPLITSLDVSPQNDLIAVSGFHEVLLLKAPDLSKPAPKAEIAQRLIGISSRIESIKFSPDGKRIAVAGGRPGQFGEVQIWDAQTAELLVSKTVSYDSVFGVNWSPDGQLVSFGCTDSTLRAIEAETGKQVLFQGAHDDWVRATVFSTDSKQLVSVGRDMSCKLTDVETERFIDNVTSITPGVLKGGIAAVTRHPDRNEIVIGGADGVPKLYRMNRITKRRIGDDANLIRRFPSLEGRINAVAISSDGKRMAAASSLNGAGSVGLYSMTFDTAMPDDIKAIVQKVVGQQSKQEKDRLEQYVTADAKRLGLHQANTSFYAVDFCSTGEWLVTGGADGKLHFLDGQTGNPIAQFDVVPISETESADASVAWHFLPQELPTSPAANPIDVDAVVRLDVLPKQVNFSRPTGYAQMIVQAVMKDDSVVDVTHVAAMSVADEAVAKVSAGIVQVENPGETALNVSFGSHAVRIPITAEFQTRQFEANFIRDVNPVLTKLGCNAGTCHGSQGGKKGFKLSLRGYDPLYDVRAFTDELGSRRVNATSPDESLMLQKPTAKVPHEGGQLVIPNSKYHALIRNWIARGAKLDLDTPRVASIELFPNNPVLARADQHLQMRVVATYEDGSKMDVTQEAVLEPGNIEVVKVHQSRVTGLRRGEAAILARYEGAFTSTTLTVMGDRSGFAWKEPEAWSEIDRLVADKWERLKIAPSGLCDDQEFVRRIYLDLTGLPPTAEQVVQFVNDQTPTREKRNQLIDALIGNDEFVEHWSNKWADLMQVNRKYLGVPGAVALRDWLRQQVRENRPYDQFARELLTASGSNQANPPASYFKIHRTPEDAMENTTHLFLATRFNCNKCHDHPFERWTQDQYYETAAFFAQIDRKPAPESKGRKIGGSAVEGAKPLFEIIADKPSGEITHVRTGLTAEPAFPYTVDHEANAEASRRARLADWITSKNNPYFATSYVNRLWGYLLGVGLIEPLDDIRAGNPPSNPELLEYLRNEFVESDFDTRHLIRIICQSRTYQLSLETNRFNDDDATNYSHAIARRLPAEVLFDSIHAVTGSELKIPGVKPGTRAAALPDSGAKLPSGFLATLGRPARESVCECERSSDLQLGSVLAFVSGPDLARAINDPNNEIAKLVAKEQDDRKVIEQIFLRVLNRKVKESEIELALDAFQQIKADHKALVKQRDERKTWFVERKKTLESERERSIQTTEKELSFAIEKHDKELLDKEAKRESAIASAEKALADYSSQLSPQAWIDKQRHEVHWHPLAISKLDSKPARPATIRDDRSVLFAKSKPAKTIFTAYASTDLQKISHLRLELLADESLPNKGPGLAENGNLVLTEFQVEIASPEKPDEWKPIKIASGRADFAQGNFPIERIFDGNVNRSGWALSPQLGKSHWATLKLAQTIGFESRTLMRFRFHQQHDDQHQIGCFRISICRYEGELGLGLSEEKLASLSVPQKQWKDADKKELERLATDDDLELKRLKQVLADSQQPVKVHPEILKVRKRLARYQQPVPDDSQLVELENNVLQSTQQLKNERLTAAQDLTWALINSPSFLFNR